VGGNLCVDTRCNYYNQTFEWRKSIGFCMKKDGDICLVAPGSPRCWAVSSSDTAPVALVLGATVELAGPDGSRVIPAAALYRDDGIEYLAKQPHEVLTTINLPVEEGVRTAYVKLRRRGSIDFPIAGAAVALKLDGDIVVEHEPRGTFRCQRDVSKPCRKSAKSGEGPRKLKGGCDLR